ncbi:DNA translocase FtsK [Methylobacterium currus]
MRDHLRTPERRERPLGVLAQTVMSLRALLARRFAPPAPPSAQRDYTLSRRATPSWMADALVRPGAPEPGVAPAAPPEPWTQSPFAPAPSPAPRPERAAAPSSQAAPAQGWAPDPAPVPEPAPPSWPVPPAARPAPASVPPVAHGGAQARRAGEPVGAAQAWPQDPRSQMSPSREVPAPDFLPQDVPPPLPAEPSRVYARDPVLPPDLPVEPDLLAPPTVVVAPEATAPRRAASSTWAPDPALMPEGGWTMPIPAAGPARAVLTRARRRDAEPSAVAPEAGPRPSSQERSPERPAESGVRFTRTPDHVLQARHRRREQALREKEEARRAAEAEAAARAAAELAAAEAARAEAEAARIEAEAAAAAAAVPLWRQPFVLPPGVRFTRTPDHLLRHPQEETARTEAVPEAEAPSPEIGSPEVAAGEAAPAPEASVAVEASDAGPVTMIDPAVAATAETAADVAPETIQEVAETIQAVAHEIPESAAIPAGEGPAAAAAPEVVAPDALAPAETPSPAPDGSAPAPTGAAEAPVAPAQVFDVPNSAILVPVDVSHLRSLPPRPVYTLDRLLQHDWTRPLPTAAEQDNRPVPEPDAEEPVAEAVAVTDEPVVAAAPTPPTERPLDVASAADLPPDVPLVGLPPEDLYPADLYPADLPPQALPPAPEPVAQTGAEAAMEVVPAVSIPADEAVAAERDVAADRPPAAILLPAPAPMLALTYAPLAETASLPVPVEPSAAPLPLAALEHVVQVEAAVEDMVVPAAAPVLPAASLAFAPVPWSFIAADVLPVTQPEALPAVTTVASAEDRPAAEPAAESTSSGAPRGTHPFVYVPTGRLNAQPPAPTLPSPPRPPRIILPIATQSVPVASHPAPVASVPVPPAAQSVPVAEQTVPPAAPAPEPDSVATAPSWSPAAAEMPVAEPHCLVIGTAGLDCDLGLDADEDGDDEDDILAPIATIPLRQAARGVEAPYELPSVDLLAEPRESDGSNLDPEMLEDNALQLQQVIQDFGVRGEILAVRPGPVVTLYEMEPAPGTKSSRVISLADDIARSMSAISARVAVVQGRNAIGIELPNLKRETVYLRELLTSPVFTETKQKLALCLGKNIGGEAIIADLARMPHLLVAGTTGSGKSVAINTMILSLLYRMKPEECRLIMVDPKMLELSVYDGIPHLLSPVVTDPKKAVIALKWAVREMEERYKKMARLGVRNIDGFNARVAEARARGEVITRTVQTGFDRETGEAVYEDEVMDLSALPYIVIVVDEMADLMMVAGKDIEGAIQRLAQMARAAGLHLIMATQRPSVDVITGTIKANFPTRISFQVTSKIDSRTILGEMGAEQLLGQGDMLFMAGGGRTTRVHGPFCSDDEVEQVVAHLKRQGRPSYLEAVTADEEAEEAAATAQDTPVMDQGSFGDPTADLYDQAVAVVLRDKKASTSYIQRRLQIGYNRAASLMERMEREGIVGPANHAGKREILIEPAPQPGAEEA